MLGVIVAFLGLASIGQSTGSVQVGETTESRTMAPDSLIVVATDSRAQAGSSEEARASGPNRSLDAAGAASLTAPEVVLYYFHRTLRCESCLATEALLAETVQTFYGDELASGTLVWLPRNLDDPENARFEEQFALEYNTAVVVRMDGREIASWKHLDKLWEFLDQKDEFLAYTRMELAEALADSVTALVR